MAANYDLAQHIKQTPNQHPPLLCLTLMTCNTIIFCTDLIIQLNFQLLLFNHGERDLNQFPRYYHCHALALNRSVMQVHKSINPLKMTPPPLPFETFYKVICFGTVTRLLVLHVFMMWILLRASQGTHV